MSFLRPPQSSSFLPWWRFQIQFQHSGFAIFSAICQYQFWKLSLYYSQNGDLSVWIEVSWEFCQVLNWKSPSERRINRINLKSSKILTQHSLYMWPVGLKSGCQLFLFINFLASDCQFWESDFQPQKFNVGIWERYINSIFEVSKYLAQLVHNVC